MSGNILVVDENIELTEQLDLYLRQEGFKVSAVHDGETALKKALNQPFDAIILDVMLPKMSGFELLRAIRQHVTTPVIMLTGRTDDIDRLVGFEVGADDYLTKPCNPNELIARLRTILRRTQKAPVHKATIEHHHFQVDCAKRQALVAGLALDLTNTEFNIFEMLIKSPGQAFSKEELTEYALGRKYTAFDRSIDVHISNLRNKLGDHSTDNPWIKTVRGFGYLLNL
ncbi:MAG TPA: DNA-binding response regulator [Legionella sp.]|nr:DNA-binding response regulator [Legionella sp.]